MLVMAELGRAYIEVRADLAKFPAELRAKLVAALKEGLSGVEFTGLKESASKAGDEAARSAGESFSRRSRTTMRKAGEEGGKGLLRGLTSIFRRGGGGGGDGEAEITKGLSGLFGNAAEKAVGSLSSIGSALNGLSGIGGVIGSIGQVALFAAVIPVVIALAGALVQLSGALFALPAVAGVAVAAIAPLVIAFQGFGEAVGAGLSGDTKAFAAALKGLPPSMQAVVKEFVTLGPVLKGIKAAVQDNFFKPLIGSIAPLAKTLLPVLQYGLSLTAGALGRMAAGFADLLGSDDIIEAIADVFESTGRIIDRLAPSLIDLTGTLIGVAEKGLPYVERFFDYLGSGIDKLTGWLSEIQQNGQLQGWLEAAAETGKQLFRVLGSATEVVFKLLGAFGDTGTNFLDNLANALEKISAYLSSDEGAKFLEDVNVALEPLLAMVYTAISLLPTLFNGIAGFIEFFRGFDDAAGEAGTAIGNFFTGIWDWITGVGSAIGNFFTETLPGYFNSVVDYATALPGRILASAVDLAHALQEWLVGGIETVVQTALFRLGQLVGFFLALPFLLREAWNALPGLLAEAWDATWAAVTNAISIGWQAVLDFFSSIPDMISAFGSLIMDAVVTPWRNALGAVWEAVSNGYNRVTGLIGSLPGFVRGLGPRLYEAAVSLGRSIGDGLSNIGNFASEIGGKIVSRVRSGVNSVIDSINSGIASIDDSIPGVSLPRIPHLAKGAIVDNPTLALIGEAGREVVLPLDNPARARELADQSRLFDVIGHSEAHIVNVTAILDGYGVLRVVDTRISEHLDQQGAELSNGARQ